MSCTHISDQHLTNSLQGKLIYKDQCTKCFVEAKSEHGIDVCLKCFNGGCVNTKLNHGLEHYLQQSSHCLALRIRVRVEEQPPIDPSQVQTLGIGVPGGFKVEQPDFIVETKVFCYACNTFVEDERLSGIEQSIRQTDSAFKKSALAQWECDVFPCEHTLTIQQYPSYKVAGEALAKCSGCELSSNLWLCLTCGALGCGRKNYDGSGGNNHGVEHFQTTKHPLVVKLGTITPDGGASVHCYDCGDEVIDGSLKEHLANFGIDVDRQTKTEKTIAELTIDANLNLTLSRLLEEGVLLDPLFGPQFTGIDNIGNSCYMNSIVQMIFHIPQMQSKYFSTTHHANCKKFPMSCFQCQVSKVAYGLMSGDFSQPKEDKPMIDTQQQEKTFYQDGIKLYDLKQLVAVGNKDFLSQRQQDALEYLEMFLKWLLKGEKQDNLEPSQKLFEFTQSDVLRCSACQGVKVNSYKTTMFKMPVEHPTKEQELLWYQQRDALKAQCEAEGKPYRPDEEVIDDLKSFQIPEYPTSLKRSIQILQQGDEIQISCPRCYTKLFHQFPRFQTFPPYLIMPVHRFVHENWVPKKLNAMIEVDEYLDLEEFREPNFDPSQKLNEQPPKPVYTAENVELIVSMGFGVNAAKRALTETANDLEAAQNWILTNMDNPDIDAPFGAPVGVPTVPQYLIDELTSMGFSAEQARLALSRTLQDNNLERASDYIFNHDMEEELQKSLQKPQEEIVVKTSSKYELYGNPHFLNQQAAVIHLGRSTHAGHYVTYIKKNGEWILYNDARVARTSKPVLGKGYIYVYRRVD